MGAGEWRQQLGSPTATEALGAALARSCPWDTHAPRSLYLHGELGSGKTTLTRGLLRALGESGVVSSPSYALIEIYSLRVGLVVHVDLYRLNSAAEFDELGLSDYYTGRTLLLVEWPERAHGRLAAADLALALEFDGEGRRAVLRSGSAAGAAWLAAARASPSMQESI
jgi:tRNA threonylcarbamoyladenosine biosynthesis protein TsaE